MTAFEVKVESREQELLVRAIAAAEERRREAALPNVTPVSRVSEMARIQNKIIQYFKLDDDQRFGEDRQSP